MGSAAPLDVDVLTLEPILFPEESIGIGIHIQDHGFPHRFHLLNTTTLAG
jgi:hypothetical protein